ncbi:MAG: lasso peptide biosynthesis B2 protein, partial [Chloroflexi bacterium]|nr:lasso peptide biosynthesis B2 protein [Chloroflexota bacterium]
MTTPPPHKGRWRRVHNFLRHPRQDQWLFVQVYILLGLARLAINTVPFRRLAEHLGAPLVESPAEVPIPHLVEARRIAWAVRSASLYTPWQSNCFTQAVAAKYLLRRRGITSTLYLGAAFKARTELEAHAWLRCGPFCVTGDAGHLHFGT